MVASDFMGVSSKGKIQSRRAMLSEMKGDKDTYTSDKNEKLEVRKYGNNMAVVIGTYREKGTGKDGKAFDRSYRFHRYLGRAQRPMEMRCRPGHASGETIRPFPPQIRRPSFDGSHSMWLPSLFLATSAFLFPIARLREAICAAKVSHMAKDANEPVADPLWYKDAIIYELHVKTFHDSDGDGMGDFRGLIEKLDYLQELGVTAIWLLPFYPSPLRDDGYDIADYFDVNPNYGTLDDFRAFLNAAHARGLRVITELVINHTSDQNPWFQKSRKAPPGSPEREFYVWSDTPEKYPGSADHL